MLRDALAPLPATGGAVGPACRLVAVDRLGPFDEEMVRNQDDEFNDRIPEGGGRIVLVPGVRSIYAVRSTPRALWRPEVTPA
jgi:GT2 family glycosyltransferase